MDYSQTRGAKQMGFTSYGEELRYVAEWLYHYGCSPWNNSEYFDAHEMSREDISDLGADMLGMVKWFETEAPGLNNLEVEMVTDDSDFNYTILGHDVGGVRRGDVAMLPKCTGYRDKVGLKEIEDTHGKPKFKIAQEEL